VPAAAGEWWWNASRPAPPRSADQVGHHQPPRTASSRRARSGRTRRARTNHDEPLPKSAGAAARNSHEHQAATPTYRDLGQQTPADLTDSNADGQQTWPRPNPYPTGSCTPRRRGEAPARSLPATSRDDRAARVHRRAPARPASSAVRLVGLVGVRSRLPASALVAAGARSAKATVSAASRVAAVGSARRTVPCASPPTGLAIPCRTVCACGWTGARGSVPTPPSPLLR